MARYIDASPAQRHFRYHKPAAVAALARGDHAAVRADILAQVEKLGERPTEGELEQRRWDRRIASLRQQYAASLKQERRDRWIAGGPIPPEVRAEFEAAGQRIPAYLGGDA